VDKLLKDQRSDDEDEDDLLYEHIPGKQNDVDSFSNDSGMSS
jgi:hypothetical protein